MSEPPVSVIIPVYNDPEGLAETLAALAGQSYPDYEVVVADNGSTDATPEVARAFRETDPDLFTLVSETEIQGSYAARNTGIRAAREDSRVFAFLDADSTVADDWLERAVAALAEQDAEYMGCRVEIPREDDEGMVARYDRLTGFPVARYVREEGYAPTNCLLVTRELLADVGGFDSRLVSGGDLEFGRRVRRSGRELHYTPEPVVTHPPRSSLSSMLGKYVRIGRGIEQNRRLHPELGHGRGLANPRQYLPPKPSTLRRELADVWEDLSIRETLTFYGLRYALDLAKRTGQLRERLSPTPESRG